MSLFFVGGGTGTGRGRGNGTAETDQSKFLNGLGRTDRSSIPGGRQALVVGIDQRYVAFRAECVEGA